jgi:hypothetical protein
MGWTVAVRGLTGAGPWPERLRFPVGWPVPVGWPAGAGWSRAGYRSGRSPGVPGTGS